MIDDHIRSFLGKPLAAWLGSRDGDKRPRAQRIWGCHVSEDGKRLTTRLGPWECIACPSGVVHGFENRSLEPVYFQVMLGRGKPEPMGYADDDLYSRRDAHLQPS